MKMQACTYFLRQHNFLVGYNSNVDGIRLIMITIDDINTQYKVYLPRLAFQSPPRILRNQRYGLRHERKNAEIYLFGSH